MHLLPRSAGVPPAAGQARTPVLPRRLGEAGVSPADPSRRDGFPSSEDGRERLSYPKDDGAWASRPRSVPILACRGGSLCR